MWEVSYIKLFGNSVTSLHDTSLEIWVDEVKCGTTTIDPLLGNGTWYGVLCDNGKRITGSTIKVKQTSSSDPLAFCGIQVFGN